MGTRIQQTDLARDALYTKVNQIADEKQDTLVSGTNIKSLNGESILGSGNLNVGSDNDNLSITKNSSDKIQTIGVIDNNSGNAIKTWTGTRAQYNAIATKDANTLYNITDDVNLTTTILEALYPVGAIYIGTQSTCPLTTLIPGSTWTLVATDRVLQGSGNNSAGSTIAAGLPNITGEVGYNAGIGHVSGVSLGIGVEQSAPTGAFFANRSITASTGNAGGYSSKSLGFEASRSNSIYGNSTTVQPPAYVVNIWQRTV